MHLGSSSNSRSSKSAMTDETSPFFRRGKIDSQALVFVHALYKRRRPLRGHTYLYNVRTEGGGGVPSKADIVIKLSKGGCVNLRTRGEGVKKSENFADVICVSSLGGWH